MLGPKKLSVGAGTSRLTAVDVTQALGSAMHHHIAVRRSREDLLSELLYIKEHFPSDIRVPRHVKGR